MEHSNKSCVSKEKFIKNLDLALSKKKETSNRYFTKAKYAALIKKIKAAKKKKKGKGANNTQRIKRFDVVKEKKKERLIVPTSDKDKDKRVYYITKDELFDLIDETHLNTDHGSKTLLFKMLKDKYKNVTHESIAIYLSLCSVCKEGKPKQPRIVTPKQTEKPSPKDKEKEKDVVSSKAMFNQAKPRGNFYFIDMQEEPDGEYKYIIVYEDDVTKFVQLKPLRSKEVKEVASVLLDIFTTFGAPSVLQSGSDEEMADGIISKISSSWKGPPIKHEKVCLEEPPNNEINKILYCWLCRSATYKWSDGLRFIQYIKNITYHEVIHKSPFEAMFGRKGKLDLSSLNLPQELISEIRSEEDPAFPDPNENMDIVEINNMLEVVMDVSD